jgi:CheY-like chemotaxis protein
MPGEQERSTMTKVMIVDDDRTMISLLRILLEMDGYQVVSVDQHEPLLDRIRQERPDVLLMDVFLTHVDGMDLLSQIRAEEDLKSLRVIMTSGMDLTEKAREMGADAFLLKPYTPEQLISLIQEHAQPMAGPD